MNRKLLKSIREYKRESILAPVFCCFGSVDGSVDSIANV